MPFRKYLVAIVVALGHTIGAYPISLQAILPTGVFNDPPRSQPSRQPFLLTTVR